MMLLLYGMFHRENDVRFKPKPKSARKRPEKISARSKFAGKLLASLGSAAVFCLGVQAQTVTLGWNTSTSVGVTGYRLYWGANSHAYTSNTNAGLLTQATVPSPAAGTTNYYAVTAYTAAGLESSFSAEIAYTAAATNSRPPGSGMTFAADAGTLTGPFVVSNHVVYQTSVTGVANGGEAIYPFTLAVPGKYVVTAMVKAPNDSANSFYVNVDAEPTDPYMIWDIGLSSGFTNQTVTWRGNSASTVPQFSPQVFTLTAGSHRLIVRGREGNTQLQSISIVPLGAQLQLVILPGRIYLVNGVGTPGYTYTVQTTSDFKTWKVLNTVTAGVDGSFSVVDPTAAGQPKRFYRLLQVSTFQPSLRLTVSPARVFALNGSGQPAYTYAVQTSADLKSWSILNTAMADASGAFSVVDPTAGATPKRFYRLHQVAP